MTDNEYGNDLLTLLDEDNVEHTFELIDSLDLDDAHYLALVPVLDDPDELVNDPDELVILKAIANEDGDEEEYLEPIEDEDEFNRVADIFMRRLEEEYDFADEDEEADKVYQLQLLLFPIGGKL